MNQLPVSSAAYSALEKFQARPHLGNQARKMTESEVSHYSEQVRDGFSRAQNADNSHEGHSRTNLAETEEHHHDSCHDSTTTRGGFTETFVDPSHNRYVRVEETNKFHDYEVRTPSGGHGFSGGGTSFTRDVEFGVETPNYIAGMIFREQDYGASNVTQFRIDSRNPENSMILHSEGFLTK